VESDHGTHDLDEALDAQDGLILNGLDNLLEVLVGYAAGGSTSGMDTGATVVNLVVGDWFNKLHPLLYRRLASFKRLESAGGAGGATPSIVNDNNAVTTGSSARVAQLERELKQALHLLELANQERDQKSAHIQDLNRQLDNSETLLGVAKTNIAVLRRDTAQEAKRLQHANKELFASVEKERSAKLVLQTRVDELLTRLDVLKDLSGSEVAKTSAKSTSLSSAQVSQLKRDLEKAEHGLELAQVEIENIKLERNEAMDMRTMGEAAIKGAKVEVSRLQREAKYQAALVADLQNRVLSYEATIRELKNAPRTISTSARVQELEGMVESMEQEIAQLEADKAALEVELDKARLVEDRLTGRAMSLEREKESISEQLEEVEEQRDVLKEEMEERESQSESNVEELREEVERLKRQLDDQEVEGGDGYEDLVQDVERLRERNAELERKLEGRLSFERSEGSEGATRGDSGRMANMARRLQEVEESARTLYETNQRLIRQRQEEADRLADLESENKALRYATPNLPANVPGLVEENRRYREQIQELMRERQTVPSTSSTGMSEDERTELESLRERTYQLELELLRTKKTSKSDSELEAELAAAEQELTKAEKEIARREAVIEAAEAARKAALDTRAQTAGMSLDQKFDFNRAEAIRNKKVHEEIENMVVELLGLQQKLAPLKGKVTKLRNQLALRRKEFELQEEANKRTKRTEARIMLGARAMVV
jgi:chromosome segregation ATPase